MQSVPVQLAKAEAAIVGENLSLKEIGHCDSAGVALLLELSRRWKSKGLKLKISSAPQQLYDLVQFFELGDILDLRTSA